MSVLEAVNMWKRSIDRRFDGVEECYICYTVCHGPSNQLPRRGCRTCKKKFHSACIVSFSWKVLMFWYGFNFYLFNSSVNRRSGSTPATILTVRCAEKDSCEVANVQLVRAPKDNSVIFLCGFGVDGVDWWLTAVSVYCRHAEYKSIL